MRVEKSVAARVVNSDESLDSGCSLQRTPELRDALEDLPWASDLAQGAVSFHSVAAADFQCTPDRTFRSAASA